MGEYITTSHLSIYRGRWELSGFLGHIMSSHHYHQRWVHNLSCLLAISALIYLFPFFHIYFNSTRCNEKQGMNKKNQIKSNKPTILWNPTTFMLCFVIFDDNMLFYALIASHRGKFIPFYFPTIITQKKILEEHQSGIGRVVRSDKPAALREVTANTFLQS